MSHRKLLAGVATFGLVAGGSAAAMAAGSAPKHTTINAVTSLKVKINRYIQDGTRWQHDVYDVSSGGTITVVNLAASDGPHTFSVVKKSDLPADGQPDQQLQDLPDDRPRAWGKSKFECPAQVPVRREWKGH